VRVHALTRTSSGHAEESAPAQQGQSYSRVPLPHRSVGRRRRTRARSTGAQRARSWACCARAHNQTPTAACTRRPRWQGRHGTWQRRYRIPCCCRSSRTERTSAPRHAPAASHASSLSVRSQRRWWCPHSTEHSLTHAGCRTPVPMVVATRARLHGHGDGSPARLHDHCECSLACLRGGGGGGLPVRLRGRGDGPPTPAQRDERWKTSFFKNNPQKVYKYV
jgi:hypothetical protein